MVRVLCGCRKLIRGRYIRDRILAVVFLEELWVKKERKDILGRGNSILGSRAK